MVLALRDYVNKNRFPGVVLGLSGGIIPLCRRRWRWMRWDQSVRCVTRRAYTSAKARKMPMPAPGFKRV